MAELKVVIKECGYNQNMQQILLKDQFIFGVTIHEIQEHLLNDIEDDQDLNHCLQEACKIESCIAQHILLGLKSVQYDTIDRDGGRTKKKSKSKDRFKSKSQSGIRDCKYCSANHQWRQCPAYGKTCKACGKKNHFAKKCRSNKGQGQSQGTGSAKKSFKYREVNLDHESSDDNGQIDEITSRIKSMYYNDVHFNSISTWMHIKLNTKSCNGNSMKTHFKVNTGVDDNLLPLGEFFKHFPETNK